MTLPVEGNRKPNLKSAGMCSSALSKKGLFNKRGVVVVGKILYDVSISGIKLAIISDASSSDLDVPVVEGDCKEKSNLASHVKPTSSILALSLSVAEES